MRLRASAGTVVALVIAVVVVTPSSGAVKAGTQCKKSGLQTIHNDRKYTCVKQGKKLLWNKGAVIKKDPTANPAPNASPSPTPTPTVSAEPSPSPTPTPTVSAEPSPSPTPTPTFTPPPRPTSFSDLIEKIDAVSYWAWFTSSEKIKKSEIILPEVETVFGPNTPMFTHNTELAVQNVSKLYGGGVAPKKVIAIYYSYADRSWGQATFAKYGLRPLGNETNQMCQTEVTCWGAMAEVDHKGLGILLMSVGDLSRADLEKMSGPLQAHEFAHTFQGSQFTGTIKEPNSYCCTKHYLPWWLVEGGATFVEVAAMNANNFESYKKGMSRSYNDFDGQNQKPYTKEWFQNFLQPESPSEWGTPEFRDRTYSRGAMVDEIFFALKGPDVSMQLMRDVATGMTWPEAFEKSFGLPWNEALPILSEALVLMMKKA